MSALKTNTFYSLKVNQYYLSLIKEARQTCRHWSLTALSFAPFVLFANKGLNKCDGNSVFLSVTCMCSICVCSCTNQKKLWELFSQKQGLQEHRAAQNLQFFHAWLSASATSTYLWCPSSYVGRNSFTLLEKKNPFSQRCPHWHQQILMVNNLISAACRWRQPGMWDALHRTWSHITPPMVQPLVAWGCIKEPWLHLMREGAWARVHVCVVRVCAYISCSFVSHPQRSLRSRIQIIITM